MKRLILTLIFGCMTTTGLVAQNWRTDFSTAKKLAAEEDKTIVLVFQGSDWCAPCIKLDREVWSTNTFKEYAKDHFVMVQADFPRKKKNDLSEEQQAANKKLAEQYNKRGIFPFVVVMDKEGNVLGETSYQKATPEEYIKLLTSFSG
ncbi:thioredoxin family protein [Maribacter halichondriae]|uniref:thioredoxin family protein n=1 Tax=Maribacter halichondriae TaxID=2980554 RepID=UPI00235931E0|nr:thioredoxin family protein [Maribacter sp. Hal144]